MTLGQIRGGVSVIAVLGVNLGVIFEATILNILQTPQYELKINLMSSSSMGSN